MKTPGKTNDADKDIDANKKAELENRDSEERLKVLFESAPDAIYLHDLKGTFVDGNKAAETLLGYSRNELVGKSFMKLNLLPAKYLKKAAASLLKNIQGKKVGPDEFELIHRNGNTIAVEIRAFPVKIQNKKLIMGIVRDISKQKAAEKQLHESEKKFRSIFENAALGIFRSTPEGKYEEVNNAFASILGFASPKQMIREVDDIAKLYKHPEDREKIKKEFEEKGYVENYEVAANHPFKDTVWITINAKQLRNSDGHTYYEGTIQDITDKKIAEEKLRETEQRLHTLADNIPDEIFIKDNQHRFVYVNNQKARMQGVSAQSMIGKTDFDYFSEPVATKSFNDDLQVISTGIPIINKEEFLTNSNGESRWVMVTKLPRINPSGEIIGTMGISRDITELKKYELALVERTANLNAVIESTGEAVWSIDRDYRILTISSSFRRDFKKFFGVDLTKGVRIIDHVPEYEKQKWLNRYNRVFKGESIAEIEEYNLGEITRFVELNLNPIYNNEIVAAVSVVTRDITIQKQAEKAVKESEEKYRSLVENIQEFVFLIDHNYKILSLNQAAINILGGNADYLNKSIKEVFPKYIYEEYKSGLDEVFDKGEYVESDTTMEFNGVKLYIHASLSPLKDENGKTIAVIGLSRDITASKTAELELRESEQKLRNIAENSTNLFYQHTTDHVLTYVSPQVEDILGYTVEEAMVKWTEMVTDNPINEEGYKSTMKAIETGKPQPTYNLELRHKNGNNVWVEVREAPLLSDGKVIGIVGALADVTKEKVAQDTLKESEERYRRLFESANVGIGISTLDGKILTANKSMTRIFGYANEDLLKLNIEKLYLDINDRKKLLHILLKEGQVQNHQFQMKTRNKGKIWVNISIQSLDLVLHDQLLFVISDITKEKESQIALKEQEKKFRTYIESSPIAIFIANNTAKYQYVNDAACELLGYTRQELLSMSIPDLQINDNIEREIESFKKVQEQGSLKGHKTQFIKKNGHIISIDLHAVRLSDNEVIAFCTDITQIKIYEQELKEANKEYQLLNDELEKNILHIQRINNDLKEAKEKAEEADRLKSAFLANMSHEIRTPMNGILGFMELLKAPDLSGEEKERYINIIRKSGDRLLSTVNDIIDISKIDSGQMEVSESDINVCEEINEHYDFFKKEASDKGIILKLINSIDEKDATISTDKVKLNSIITNLIKNAIKYTDSGSIDIYCSKKGSNLEVKITDTGIGIPENRIDSIFNRFEQADINDTHARQGSGLGLSITKAYVEKLGGQIAVESEPDKGSTFSFTLPWTGNHQAPVRLQNKGEADIDISKKYNILIAEDDDISFQHLKIILNPLSKKLERVTNGRDAIDYIRNNPDTHLILMDVKMPLLSGSDATREIRKFNKEVVIIAQTAYALAGDEEKLIDVGCNNYISKPINKDRLFQIITEYLI